MKQTDTRQRTGCPEEIQCRLAIAQIDTVSHGDAAVLITRLNDLVNRQAAAVAEALPYKRQEWYMYYRREMQVLADECAAWPGEVTVMKRGNRVSKGKL